MLERAPGVIRAQDEVGEPGLVFIEEVVDDFDAEVDAGFIFGAVVDAPFEVFLVEVEEVFGLELGLDVGVLVEVGFFFHPELVLADELGALHGAQEEGFGVQLYPQAFRLPSDVHLFELVGLDLGDLDVLFVRVFSFFLGPLRPRHVLAELVVIHLQFALERPPLHFVEHSQVLFLKPELQKDDRVLEGLQHAHHFIDVPDFKALPPLLLLLAHIHVENLRSQDYQAGVLQPPLVQGDYRGRHFEATARDMQIDGLVGVFFPQLAQLI